MVLAWGRSSSPGGRSTKHTGGVGTVASRRSQLRWVVGVSLWLVLVPAGLLVVRVFLPSDGLPVGEASEAFSNGALRVSPPEPVRQIYEGDSVVSIDGRSTVALLADPVSRRVARGDQLAFVVRRGSERFTTTVTVGGRRQFGALIARLWPLLVTTVLILGLAIWLVARCPDEPAAHALLLFSSALVALPLVGLAYLEPLDLWARPWVSAWSMLGLPGFMELPVALVMFALAFPSGSVPNRAATTARWFTLVPIGVFIVSAATYLLGGWSLSRDHLVDSAAGVWWMLGAVGALGILAGRGWRLRREPVARRQSQIVLLGLALSLGSGFVLNLVPNDVPAAWFALVFLAFPASIAVAVAHKNLFALDLILNRGLVAVTTGGVLFAVYVVLVAATSAIAGGAGSLSAIPAAGAVAVLFAPVRERSQRWVGMRLFGLAAEPGVVFERLGERLSGAGDPDALMAAVVETVTESLRLPYAAVELVLTGAPRIIEQRGQPGDTVESVELRGDGRVLGWLHVSPRRGESTLSARDTELLDNLGRHAAVAAQVSLLTNTVRETQHQVMVSREAERDRVQRDLHDRIGPVLVGLALQLSALDDEADPHTAKELLGRLQVQASDALEDVRRLARDLRPAELEEIGLFATLEAAATRLSATDGLRFDVNVPLALPRLSREREEATYMVFLEAMTNAVRHSGGRHAAIRLAFGPDRSLHGIIEDDGSGIADTTAEGTGLRSIRERITACGGHVEIGRSPSGGAMIRFQLPLEDAR